MSARLPPLAFLMQRREPWSLFSLFPSAQHPVQHPAALIAATTGPNAEQILANIEYQLERNQALADDYPEVCDPILAFDGTAQRGMARSGWADVARPQAGWKVRAGFILDRKIDDRKMREFAHLQG